MTSIEATSLTHRYRAHVAAVRDVSFQIPAGSITALLGPNGAGKSTLLQCCAGLLDPSVGHVRVLGRDVRRRAAIIDGTLGVVSADTALPTRMTLAELERWIAPLHRRWDATLATELRERFALDRARSLDALSRGERMKVRLWCTMSARPRVILMDEPFTGIDTVAKDDLIRGLLSTVCDGETTVLIASHDIAELEPVADRVLMLSGAHVRLNTTMDALRARFSRITLVGSDALLSAFAAEQPWLAVERAGRRLSVIADGDATPVAEPMLRRRLSDADSVEMEALTLREVFATVARDARADVVQEAA
jgi:ABC-2 type transport system ATP-binding protein